MTRTSGEMVRKTWETGVGLFACGRETVGSVKMGVIAVQIVAISVAANPEQGWTKLHVTVCYSKWPTTVVGQGSYGKFVIKHL